MPHEPTERIDTPNHTLNKDLMFIKSNKCTESSRIKYIKQQTRAGSVTLEYLALHKNLACIRFELFSYLLLGLSEGQCLSLGKEIR